MPFIYTINLSSGNNKVEGIPVFGFCPTGADPSDDYYKAKSPIEVKNITSAVAGGHGMTLGVPYPEVFRYFKPQTKYDSMTIFPNAKPDDQFNVTGDPYSFDSISIGENRIMPFGAFKFTPKEMLWITDFGAKNLKNRAGTAPPPVGAMLRPFAVDVYFDQLR